MQFWINFIPGVIILILVMYDFFFTTLSVHGSGYISRKFSVLSNHLLRILVHRFGRRVYIFSGLILNLFVLAAWIILVWVSLFLIFSSCPEDIVNEAGEMASAWERLYFTGYVISTLGIGNIYPTSPAFEVLTSGFSFFGFIFFTSSMTYFISVSSGVIDMRTLAKSIYSLGNTPQKIAQRFQSLDFSYSTQQLMVFQEMINKISVNHHAYPVIHYYKQAKVIDCFSLNLTRLDEALSLLLDSGENNLREEIQPLRTSLTTFLENIEKDFSKSLENVQELDSSFVPYEVETLNPEGLQKRRRILKRLLKSEGFVWKDVHEPSRIE